MAYGHAERNLAAIRSLEAETAELLSRVTALDPEESEWLESTAAGTAEPAPRVITPERMLTTCRP